MDFWSLLQSLGGEEGPKSGLGSENRFEDINLVQALGVLLIFVNTSFANSAGIGGGPITVCILMYLFDVDSTKAIALSQISIFGGSIIATAIKTTFKHPIKRKHSLIDYKLITLVIPILMISSSTGSLLTRLVQDWIVLTLLSIIAWIICILTIIKGIKVFKEENKQLIGYHRLTVEAQTDESEPETQLVYYFILIFSVIVMVIFNLFKGDTFFESVIGVEMCGSVYIGLFVSYHILVIIQTVLYGAYLSNDLEKQGSFYTEIYGTKVNMAKLAVFSYATGLLSGALGMGGGLIMNPIFLLIGLNPDVSTASCNAIVLATSIASSLCYTLAGYLGLFDGLGIMGLSMLGSITGIFLIKSQVEKYKRMSIIVFILASMLTLVGILVPLKLVNIIYKSIQDGSFSYGLKHIC